MNLNFRLQPKQLRLLDMMENGSARVLAYGGARGGAKSYAARACMLIRRLKYPGTHGLLLRKTFPELQSNHLTPLFTEFPFLRKYYNAQSKLLTLPNGSTVEFRTANDDGRLSRLQGSEWVDIDVDEAGQFLEDDIVWLQTCLRYGGVLKITPRMVLTANPGGVGHAFLKRLFVDKDYRENERPEDYEFIQSFAQDNVVWAREALRADGLTEKDYYAWSDKERFDYFISRTDYGKVLNALPDALKGPHLFGRWDIFAGQYFDNFDPAKHVVSADSFMPQPWWPRWIGMDWGFSDSTAVYWCTSDPKGKTYVYRELVINHTTADKIGGLVGEITQKAGEQIEEFDLSRDAFARKQSERTIADELDDAIKPYGLPPPQFADQDRVGGWQLLYQLLDAEKLVIVDCCKRLISTIPMLIRDAPNKPEDVLGIPGDDPADAWRYAIKTRARVANKPHEMVVNERLRSMNLEPTDFMRERTRLLAEMDEEEAGVRPILRGNEQYEWEYA